jgi:hypothetical protein
VEGKFPDVCAALANKIVPLTGAVSFGDGTPLEWRCDRRDEAADRGIGRVSRRAAPWLAWSLAGLSVTMFLAGVALFVLARSAQLLGTLGASVDT